MTSASPQLSDGEGELGRGGGGRQEARRQRDAELEEARLGLLAGGGEGTEGAPPPAGAAEHVISESALVQVAQPRRRKAETAPSAPRLPSTARRAPARGGATYATPSEERAKRLSKEDLRLFFVRAMRPDKLQVVVVGPVADSVQWQSLKSP